ncbi:enoyl-hydratase isomerase [Ceraceosorus bombacis]|uniref:Enoyl-hydratase isomerase n=1 Tax=Ceraceosorus bombacis TaxID=401625 RepID=A0A0P1BFJ8_9BASI|nr:enoyl-hydratase isomerase [Ceraceosorus bombacis]
MLAALAPTCRVTAQRTASATLAAAARPTLSQQARTALPFASRTIQTTVPRLSTPPSSDVGDYKNIIVSQAGNGVTLITLNRPKALNALNSELFTELNHATAAADEDASVNAIVITGSEKAFAAGADIKEMRSKEFAGAYKSNFLGHWTKISEVRKPIIAAVSGFARG